jgi:hypothetical protein
MSKVTLRNVNAIGYTDLPEIGRTGPSPRYGECGACIEDPTSDHEHELLNPEDLEHGSGCLMPGETFEVDAALAEELLKLVGTFELAEPDDGLGHLSKAELVKHAAEHDPPIDLGGATTKAAILAAIRKG